LTSSHSPFRIVGDVEAAASALPEGIVLHFSPMIPASMLPNEENVSRACNQFDSDPLTEKALKDLFTQYHRNDNHSQVLLKVVSLNRLYAAGILNVYPVARHIHDHAQEIDSGLSVGSPEVVDIIAPVRMNATGKVLHFWAFATKYCSWHRPELYPIWDANVARYLRSLKGSDFTQPEKWTDYPQFADYGGRAGDGRWRPDNWTHYREFVVLMSRFRDFYNLRSFMFKDIDKFLWLSGGELKKGDLRS
jgi:hypothetical protein